VIVPVSDHVLDGVTVKAALQILKQAGYKVCREKMCWDDIKKSNAVILTNALMGAVPVLDAENVEIAGNTELVTLVNKGLLGTPDPW
jgi:branched-subunit amino acid aminotransferase/4-amino-4-deoxychorismate lyase